MSIVVGYVPTPEGNAALERSVTEARDRGARLVVVDLSRPESVAEGLGDRVRASAGDDVSYTVREVPDGMDAVETVLQITEEERADLVVIGLRRRTPVGKLILGAQAQRILLDAPCPVLTVKPAAAQSD